MGRKPQIQGRDGRNQEVERKIDALLSTTTDSELYNRLQITKKRMLDLSFMLATCRMSIGNECRPACYPEERAAFPDTPEGLEQFEVRLEDEVAQIKTYVEAQAASRTGAPQELVVQQIVNMQQMIQDLQKEIAELKKDKP